ncbi:MAG: S41 family peptidase [Gemmatimonadota bacterium]|jgi:carboxyl-terminal processing protease
MKRFSTVIAPGLVLLTGFLVGGWLLQKGVGQEKNVYFQVRLFEEVMGHVLTSYVDPVDREELYSSAIQGVLSELGDPNTSFLPASDADDFRIRMGGEYGGVGLEVIPQDGWTTVVTALPGTPGTRAGMRPGDQIVEVEGVSVEGWSSDEVVGELRGRPGIPVEVKVRRPGVDVPIPFTIIRESIQLRSVPFVTELEGGVGYVPLQSVTETSFQEVREAVDSLRATGVEELILDLRGNTGGPLDQGIAIADFFLDPDEIVVETRGRAANQSHTYGALREQAYRNLTVVALVDERSASASEIIAGALQDHDRALVVGAPTFGKGSVQTLFPLTGGNILRLTTARWYTPLGRSIHKEREDQIRALERSTITLTGDYATRPDTAGKPVFRTEGGRSVLGGGGIIPDVLVVADTLTTPEQAAFLELSRSGSVFNTAVFNYAVEYLQDHRGLEEGFSLGEEDLRDLQNHLAESGVGLSPPAFRAAQRFIQFYVEREIASQAWGDVGEFRRTVGRDKAIQRALELLSQSTSTEELLDLSTDPDFSDWIPVSLLDEELTRAKQGSESGS